MYFRVVFVAKGSYIVTAPARRLGLNWLDRVRDEIRNVPHLDIERVDNILSNLGYYEVACFPSEKQAREAGSLFRETSEVKVRCPANWLDDYVEIGMYIIQDERTGEIRRVSPEYKINTGQVIKDWLEAGAPTRWGLSEEE